MAKNLLETIGNPTFCQIIRRHFDGDFVARQDANTVFPHTSRRMGDNFVIIHELHAKCSVGQKFNDFAFKFQEFFFSQFGPFPPQNRAISQLLTVYRDILLILKGLLRVFELTQETRFDVIS